jgi:hypothetical protein
LLLASSSADEEATWREKRRLGGRRGDLEGEEAKERMINYTDREKEEFSI